MGEDNYSLSSRVFHTIRENILSGKYATDEELKEKNIGEELGVSRTPVREALRQLELEGLVTIIPNKGAYVVGISKKDIQDIYEIRSRLEGLCAKWAADKITKEQLDELDENSLSVFPNPAQDKLFIADEKRAGDILSVTIENALGEMMKQAEWEPVSTFMNVNLSDFQSGLYTVRIQTTKGVVVKKFVKL